MSKGKTNILVIGSGAREHMLARSLVEPSTRNIFVAPGNSGTGLIATNVAIKATDVDALLAFAKEHKVSLTVVGPENPLELGIVDAFRAAGLRIFGPTKLAAQIETSKIFTKNILVSAGVPTAHYQTYTHPAPALYAARRRSVPFVVKASGLAGGKGAIVCRTPEEGEAAVRALMVDRIFKTSGDAIVMEDFLEGEEISVHALVTNGEQRVYLPVAQDHKQAEDGDMGQMTGGMGAIAPVPWVTPDTLLEIDQKIFEPVLRALRERGMPFTGCLFAGIMMTKDGPYVLEFNARFGDPETAVMLPLLEGDHAPYDLLTLLNACADGEALLSPDTKFLFDLAFPKQSAAGIVLASAGYPGPVDTGHPITMDQSRRPSNSDLIPAGISQMEDGTLTTSGGRVCIALMVAPTLEEAIQDAYRTADCVDFKGKMLRHDIGAKALQFLATS